MRVVNFLCYPERVILDPMKNPADPNPGVVIPDPGAVNPDPTLFLGFDPWSHISHYDLEIFIKYDEKWYLSGQFVSQMFDNLIEGSTKCVLQFKLKYLRN